MGSKDTFFSNKPSLNCRGELLSLDRPLVMGILNITPDSFYKGSRKTRIANIRDEAGKMVEQGASILDVGAVSTRPGRLQNKITFIVVEDIRFHSDRIILHITVIDSPFVGP